MQYCDIFFKVCLEARDWLNLWLSFVAVIISFISLVVAVYFAMRTFRPIISAAVKTHSGDDAAIIYNLEVLNSGTLPAKNIRLIANPDDISFALAQHDQYKDMEKKWLACFEAECLIPVLQNGTKTSCSFGLTREDDVGFWRYGASIPITVEYFGWFGTKYSEPQIIYIRDSDSFTGYMWSPHTVY